ncbi:uncharacterized protein LOC133420283 isoform X2 [Cololabis saira]|uniref:uncharacterized protein LOC133420283 isoform X2 n=1 Tax=Cololabis saira TaxID=129043 RepID=UPI002AD366B5|nr:uncharacterized protein LOC133420283 isoform X2 [Cololabis saira]
MTIIRDLFALLGTAIIMVCQCGADRPLPEVTGVSYEWIDPFVLKLHWSWMRPEALPKSCQVQFSVKGENKDRATTERLNTREEHVDMCYLTKSPATTRIYIHVCPENCSGWTISQTVNKTIEEPNNAELVKDFKCVMKSYNMTWNCTWTPAHPSLKLDVSYRKSGKAEKDLNRLTTCREFITTGEQRGCHVHTDPQDIWVLAKTDSQRHIFKPRLVVPLPNVTLKEDGPLLRVTWHPPKVGRSCKWILNVWYKACHNTETLKERDNFTIPYDSCCVYKLRYNVSTDKDCLEVSSDNSPILTYGTKTLSAPLFRSRWIFLRAW